jgi:hypothetical protein
MHDHEAVAQALSEAGADFEETGMDTNGVPLLILAVRQGHEVVAQALRESAANATQCPLAEMERILHYFSQQKAAMWQWCRCCWRPTPAFSVDFWIR